MKLPRNLLWNPPFASVVVCATELKVPSTKTVSVQPSTVKLNGLLSVSVKVSACAGDKMLRTLLVSSTHYILGPFSQDSDLKRHGQKIASRGGKNAKKRAVVAVARKLSVVLHHLWVSGEVYEPLHNARCTEAIGEEIA
jgi:hypothetical protein